MRGYYKKIKGKQYDGHLIRLADESVKGKGDGRISLKDAKKILAAVKDSDAYTDIEKATMHFIRDHYAFTGEANAWFRTEIRKWAATKGAAAGSAKKRVPAVKKAAAATPVKKQKPKAAPKKTAKKAVKKHARPSAAPKKEPVYVTESFEERARFDQRVVEHEEEKRSSRLSWRWCWSPFSPSAPSSYSIRSSSGSSRRATTRRCGRINPRRTRRSDP
ncbi:MAG TPA: hypothetical protein PLE73_10015 [Spirochaetota bacterium]|nr:hypothetical protein [Spirochaetota bacterium]